MCNLQIKSDAESEIVDVKLSNISISNQEVHTEHRDNIIEHVEVQRFNPKVFCFYLKFTVIMIISRSI